MHDPAQDRCCDIVVIAASAGGVEALSGLIRGLPEILPAALFVLLHMPETDPSLLPQILGRCSAMPVEPASDRQIIQPGHVYVAVPGKHMALRRGRVRLLNGPRENGHRPSADVLFRSAAQAYGPRVLGIVLSGADADGAAGLIAIKRAGGMAIVQDPKEALHPRMPQSALDGVDVDHCLPVSAIAQQMTKLARVRAFFGGETVGKPGVQSLERNYRDGPPAVYTCPECHGTLWEVDEGEVVRFRCRVGHAYTAEHLLAGQAQNVEAALWMALRTLEERAQLSDNMAQRASQRGLKHAARRFEQSKVEAQDAAGTLRRFLLEDDSSALASEDAVLPGEPVLDGL